jgi:beta-phosphoglucomutase-like phosphatase (HAD superfamily)
MASSAIRAFISALKLRRCLDFISAPFPRQRFYTLLSGPNFGEHFNHHANIPVLVAYHDVDNVKPHPEALLLASQKLGIDPSRCIYVGDDRNDVQAARAARFIPIGVCWGNQVDIGLSSICTSWDEVYDEIVRLIE